MVNPSSRPMCPWKLDFLGKGKWLLALNLPRFCRFEFMATLVA